jgi:4-alpha-glucanotransferase
MVRQTITERGSGILLHPTSLPGPHGCGDLGPAAHNFVDFLATAGQRWWQMLPVGPTGYGNSPYGALSSFAGNRLLVSPERLAQDGLLRPGELERDARLCRDRADFGLATKVRERLLRRAFTAFLRQPSQQTESFEAFCHENRRWLEDWALYWAIKQRQGGAPWTSWEEGVRRRRPGALARARRALRDEVRFEQFVQYEFARQFTALREHARARGLGLIGDIPIFVALDSADVWASPEIFRLDTRGMPLEVAGVPPDYFSETGQLWGNPLYRWNVLRRGGYAWWVARLRKAMERFDLVRLDHFIGFYRAWAIPFESSDARRGRWVPGPRADFFECVRRRLGGLPFIAEDLGLVVPQVVSLREKFGLPGMCVLQFAFGDDGGTEEYRPYRHQRRSVVYTGTHDNDTTVGWFKSLAEGGRGRSLVLRYLGTDGREIHWDFIRLALASVADTAIFPLQDVLGLGSEARMNRPGVGAGNWEWRFPEGALGSEVVERLGLLTETYGRKTARPAGG